MTAKMMQSLALNYIKGESEQKEVKNIMGGRVLNYPARAVYEEGLDNGRIEGKIEGKNEISNDGLSIVKMDGISDKEKLELLEKMFLENKQ